MKLVVLGNGFDLTCGLPTSYSQFFEWRYSHIERSKLDDIDNLYMNFNHYEYNIGSSYSTPDINIKISGQIKNTIKIFLDYDMSFWDVYFYLLKLENSPITNWCDVEKQIETAITSISGRALIDKVLDYGIDKIDKAIKLRLKSFVSGVVAINFSQHNEYINDANYAKETILGIFMELKYPDNFGKILESDYYFLKELNEFENSFKSYLEQVVLPLGENPHWFEFSEIYINNFKEICTKSEKCFLINFNYTCIKKPIEEVQILINSGNGSGLPTLPKEVIENNVHGNYKTTTIFGIDNNKFNPSSTKYMFTKTYRKLCITMDNILNTLPPEVNEIIFYGHSLSDADYSYFQSLFDYYDIYHSKIKLSFKYSHYDESIKEEIDKNQYFAVSKLIHTYGATMDNKDHGKNLLHKLLLENRLKLECISLQSIKK